jgi:hypothetical protein
LPRSLAIAASGTSVVEVARQSPVGVIQVFVLHGVAGFDANGVDVDDGLANESGSGHDDQMTRSPVGTRELKVRA